MIQLTSLRMFAVDTSKTVERPGLIGLLQLCSSIDGLLLAWNKDLKKHDRSPLYWAVPSVAESPADDPVLGRVFPLAFHFPSLKIAQLLLLYWSMLILLYCTIQDIQERFTKHVTGGSTTQHSFGLQGGDRSEVYSGPSCPSKELITHLANNIVQSLEYCYRTKNGTLGHQITIFPLWVARSFYESQSDRSRELAWCSALGNTTAPDARFDLCMMRCVGQYPSEGTR
jgi:hypothetical protein